MVLAVEIERKFLIRAKPGRAPDRVHKIRQGYIAREGGNTVRVREKDGDLIIAEVELGTVDEDVILPDWIGPEVTELSKFYNANIATMPFESWRISYEALVERLSG